MLCENAPVHRGQGGCFVRGQEGGEYFVFQVGVKIFHENVLHNSGFFLLFLHPQCPSALQDKKNAALV